MTLTLKAWRLGQRALLLAAALSMTLASASRAQVSAPTAAAQWPRVLRESIDRLADSARTLGLPTDPLYAKAAEGFLKGADNTRIVDAVSRLKHDLGDARAALGPDATTAELVAAASVLHSGMDIPTLRRLKAVRDARPPSASLVMPLVVLSDLLARRVTPDVAVASLSTLLSHGARDAQFTALRQDIERDIAGGQTPDLAARTRTDAVVRSLGPTVRPLSRPPSPDATRTR